MTHNGTVEKIIIVDERAKRELKKFPYSVQLKFQALFEIIEESGRLAEPFAKKLAGREALFEIRVKYKGEWRAL